jgi:hypothetical protein
VLRHRARGGGGLLELAGHATFPLLALRRA